MENRNDQLRAELKAHLDMAIRDRVERGEVPRDAAAAARRELGNLSQIQEATRDVWGRRWLEQAAQDTRYAFRTFRRNPGFALVAIGTACGIGLALAGGRTAAALLFRVTPYDPLTLAAAVALLAVIAVAASYAPARRATRIEPVTALRAE